MMKKVILVSAFCALIFIGNIVCAEDEGFNKNNNYDIYYVIGDSKLQRIKDVKIEEFVTVEGSTFLVIKGSGFGGGFKKEGYILFETIKAILPHGAISPQDTLKIQ